MDLDNFEGLLSPFYFSNPPLSYPHRGGYRSERVGYPNGLTKLPGRDGGRGHLGNAAMSCRVVVPQRPGASSPSGKR